MSRVRWNKATLPSYVHSMYSNTEDWQYIRKTPDLQVELGMMVSHWVGLLNDELAAAQAARKQPIEPGYKWSTSVNEDRIRIRIWAYTARAMAHEAKHQSILKMMRRTRFDVKQNGRAQWDWGKKSKGKSRARKPGAKPGGSKTRPSPSRPAMDPRREASLRRKLAALDALATEGRGGTEAERKSAAEKARRIRSELGD